MEPQIQALHPSTACVDLGKQPLGTSPGSGLSVCKDRVPPFMWGLIGGRDHLGAIAGWNLYCLFMSSSPRLATSEAPDGMEEWDVPQMKKEVESLKYQLAFKREMSSKSIPE